ncbi:MAG: flagellar biosynthesis anti-sigma factor FlgM [Treponemataceae bacterium]
MVIDRLAGIDPLKNVQSSQKPYNKTTNSVESDSISVSSEAKLMAEAYRLNEVAAATPDVRLDRIAEVREKIKDPNYITDTVLNDVADRIMNQFGI